MEIFFYRELSGESVTCRYTSCMESATDTAETREIIDNNFWATFKDLLVPM